MLISMSIKVDKNKSLLYEARNKLEEKKIVIENLDLRHTNVMVDRDDGF